MLRTLVARTLASAASALMPTHLLFLAALTPFLHAQSTSATITGRISDPSGAFISAARVSAISAATNLHYEAETNASGEYSLANLPPGAYSIAIDKTGFKRLVKPDVILHVQDALTIDFQMTLGDASETINVEGGAPLVNAESATVSTVVDSEFVENLPLNGRSFQTLIALIPGVVITATGFQDQGQFSVNGQHADANYFTVDGVSANFGMTGYQAMVQTASGALPALSAQGGTNSLVSVDAMQEFRIQTSSFAPEFGRTPGAQVSIVTRSGTNAFHGTAFEYFRNDKLDARDWFVNYNGLPKPAERQNDFGGVVGGPIVKNKTFFFFSYEGLRLRQPVSQTSVVPDAAARKAAPPGIQPFLNVFPIANGPEVGGGLAQFTAGYSNPSSLDATSFRLDQVLTSKLTLFGRYDYSPSDYLQRAPAFGGTILNLIEPLTSYVHTGTIGLTALITPRISNEVRLNYSNQSVGTAYEVDSFGGGVPLPDSQLFPPGTTSATGFFAFYIPSIGEYAQGKAAIDEQRQFNFVDNVAVTHDSHQMKFGVDYRWLSPIDSTYAYRTYVQFNGFGSNPGGTLSSIPASANTLAMQSVALLSHNFSLYGQDTWKITPRLTLTYGLRWDVNPPLKGKNDASEPFTLTGISSTGVNPATVSLAPRGTPLYQTTWGNVAPRVGVAYQISPKTVLRGGFGIFYDLGQGSLGGVSFYFPFSVFKILPATTTFPFSPTDAAAPALTTALPTSTLLVADPNLKLPRSYQWNVAVEQSLGRSQSLSLTYVGAVGRDLLRVTQLSNINPNFPNISLTTGTATSDYHALQIKFQRRLASGLQALASYSWSHSIDDSSTDAFATRLNTPGSLANPNVDRGDSDFDIRHSFSAGLTYAVPSRGVLLGGWSVDSFVLARSAPPVDIIGALVQTGGISLYPRPDVVPGAPLELYGSGYPGGRILNKAAFTAPPAGRQGDFGRNVLRGFDATQVDVGVQRTFRIHEDLGLRFRAELFNILNHPNFANPTNSITNALFGYTTQTLANGLGAGGANGGFNPLYQIGGPRSVQLALKLVF